MEWLYKAVGWPAYKHYGHAYDGFRVALNDSQAFWDAIRCGPEVTQVIKDELAINIARRMTPQKVKIRAGIAPYLKTYSSNTPISMIDLWLPSFFG